MKEKEGVTMSNSYFPLLIEYSENKKRVVVKSAYDIIRGETFKVIECNTQKNNPVT